MNSSRALLHICLLGGVSAGAFSDGVDAKAASERRAAAVEVVLRGPKAIRVRVSEGQARPCDAGDDHFLIEGKFAPGQVVWSSTFETCVCVQQTFEPFTDVDWSVGGTACRAQVCTGYGKARRCVEAPDPTIRINLSSARRE